MKEEKINMLDYVNWESEYPGHVSPNQNELDLVPAYSEENNPILTFLKEIDGEELLREPISHWYTMYCGHCLGYGFTAISRNSFTRTVKKQFGLDAKVRKVDGKTHRFFVKL